MKAVIVECSNGAAVALCDDGSFRKLKNRGYSIGQELLIQRKQPPNRMMRKLSICASLALVLLSFAGIGSHSYVEPYSYVSLDINPSIEYALNRYDKVISVSGINTEGQQVVSSIEADIKNQNITTALGVTIGQLEKDHYIVEEGYNHVIVSVYSSNDSKAQSITSRVNSFSAEKSDICSIDTIPVSKEVKDDADSLGITPGKLALIHAVAETTSDSNFDVSAWTDKSVSELETTIQQASNQASDTGSNPAPANAVNSDYLSNVLNESESAANRPDSSAASSTDGAQGAGSASTDRQPTTTDDHAAGSGTDHSVSATKPDHAGNTAPSAADSAEKSGTGSSNAATADTGSAANQDHSANASDKNTSSGKDDSNQSGTSSSKNPSTADSASSPAKGDSSSGSKKDTNDNLTEDSSSKKDSYPVPDTTTSEDASQEDKMQEDTSSKNLPYKEPSDNNAPDDSHPDSPATGQDASDSHTQEETSAGSSGKAGVHP